MILNDVLDSDPGRKRRKRVGRGIGSGRGKTCTRGTKGQGSRTGSGGLGLMEGGQMPLFRRLPHRGFNNARFAAEPFAIVNVSDLEARFESGDTVDLAALQATGLVKKNATKVKVLGTGDLAKKLTLKVHAVSGSARAKVEAAQGSITELGGAKKGRPKGVKKPGPGKSKPGRPKPARTRSGRSETSR